jgi:preprotein translocase subunit SecG
MNIVMNLVLALQIVTALVMIGLVLIQHGKGADMGASFGSGASGSLFGASGSANFLSRSTAAVATVFFVATLGLAYTQTALRTPAPTDGGGGGVMGTMAPKGDAKGGDAKGAADKSIPGPAEVPPTSQPAPATPAKKADEIPK